jgi:hypothetical protein
LDHLRNAKFGLCLRGFGRKCHMEVVLMTMGTVPLVIPSVCIGSYAEPPIEGVHFRRVTEYADLIGVVNYVSEEKLNGISVMCIVRTH